MTYQHSDKAGNPGDVVKHAFLAELLARYAGAWKAARPSTWEVQPFVYLETHSGPAAHLLTPGGEWEEGLGALEPCDEPGRWEALVLQDGMVPSAQAEGYQPYPGSSLLALTALQEAGISPFLTLSELDPKVATELEASYRSPGLQAGDPASYDPYKIVVLPGDGYDTLRAALDETPRPSFVFIDPPAFDAIQVQQALTRAHEAKVRALAWLPLVGEPGETPPEGIGLETWCADMGFQSFRSTWPRPGREDRCTRGCLLVGAGFEAEDWAAAATAVTKLGTPQTWAFADTLD